jgi:hypothetical protein
LCRPVRQQIKISSGRFAGLSEGGSFGSERAAPDPARMLRPVASRLLPTFWIAA